jgi:predicted PhzF superfamily epimerase YddE/YHI9
LTTPKLIVFVGKREKPIFELEPLWSTTQPEFLLIPVEPVSELDDLTMDHQNFRTMMWW